MTSSNFAITAAAALYHQGIKEMAAKGDHQGRLDSPDGEIVLDNPMCGDRIKLTYTLSGGSQITGIKHQVKGCMLCKASAEILCDSAINADANQIKAVAQSLLLLLTGEAGSLTAHWQRLEMFAPVKAHKSRYNCVLLPFNALLKGMGA